MNILKAIFGTKAQRDVKRLRPMVQKINEIEQGYQKLTDDELKAKTQEFRTRFAGGETDFTLRTTETRHRIHEQQDFFTLITELFRDGRRHISGFQTLHTGAV